MSSSASFSGRVKHRAWLENFEEGLPWELTLVGRMVKRLDLGGVRLLAFKVTGEGTRLTEEVGPYQEPKKIKVGKAGAYAASWNRNAVSRVLQTPLTPYDPPSLTDAVLGMRPGEIRRVVVPPEHLVLS